MSLSADIEKKVKNMSFQEIQTITGKLSSEDIAVYGSSPQAEFIAYKEKAIFILLRQALEKKKHSIEHEE